MAIDGAALKDLLVQQLSASVQIINGIIAWINYADEVNRTRDEKLIESYNKMLNYMFTSYLKLLSTLLNSLGALFSNYSRIDARMEIIIPNLKKARELLDEAGRHFSSENNREAAEKLEAAAEKLLAIEKMM